MPARVGSPLVLVAVAAGSLATGCVDWSENDHMTNHVVHWKVTDETTQQLLSQGCSLTKRGAGVRTFKANPGQRIAFEVFFETIDKSQKEAIPIDDDAFWCSTRSDATRRRDRLSGEETCASTDPAAPATLDSVELIEPQPSGLFTTSIGYILHLTVVGSGQLDLRFKSPPCSMSGTRTELVILPP
jgi:hypothetical protein